MTRSTDEQIKFNKIISQLRKHSQVNLCIWADGDQKIDKCSENIIDAHSIQRGKILSSIAENGEIYCFGLSPSKDVSEMGSTLKLDGIKRFSTFKGFCGTHDKIIFQPIEDKDFIASTEQKNIYAYRAFAKELHANLQSLKGFQKQLEDLEKDIPDFLLSIINAEAENQDLNIQELQEIVKHIKNVMMKHIEPEYEHIYFSFDKTYPIACSTCFIPYTDFDGERLIHAVPTQKSPLKDIPLLALNVFPEKDHTHVIFTFFKNNLVVKKSLQSLFKLDSQKIKIGLSNLILNYVENVAFSPEYITKNFSDEEIKTMNTVFLNNINFLDKDSFIRANMSLFKD